MWHYIFVSASTVFKLWSFSILSNTNVFLCNKVFVFSFPSADFSSLSFFQVLTTLQDLSTPKHFLWFMFLSHLMRFEFDLGLVTAMDRKRWHLWKLKEQKSKITQIWIQKGSLFFVVLVLAKSKAMSVKKRAFSINIEEAAVDFFNHLLQEKPRIPVFIPLILIAWAIERWVFSASTWVPLALAVWTTIQVLTPQYVFCPQYVSTKS